MNHFLEDVAELWTHQKFKEAAHVFICLLDMYGLNVANISVICSFRRWLLDLTWLHMGFLTSIPCAWTRCSCVSVSTISFPALMSWVRWDTYLSPSSEWFTGTNSH